MGWFSKLVGAPDPADIIQKTGNALDGLFTSKEEKLTHEEVMARIEQNPQEWQFKLTLAEAGHRSVFVAGWRPFIGWVAGISLFFYFVPQYVMASVLWVQAAWGADSLPPFPVSADGLLELVLGLLGLATLRSAEKVGRVTR